MQVLRLVVLWRGLAEYGSPSGSWRVSVEAWMGCRDAEEGGGDSDGDRLREGTETVCGTLDFLTWTDEGRSEDTCFSRERICRDKLSLLEIKFNSGYFNISAVYLILTRKNFFF